MVLPRLIHPVDVIVEQVDHSTTYYDEDAREEIQIVGRDVQKTVQGQIKWVEQQALSYEKAGVGEGSRGYVLFRKVDLDAASITLQPNDRIKKMGHVDTDVYINRLEWLGHYPDQSGPALIKAYFIDRAPSHQSRGP